MAAVDREHDKNRGRGWEEVVEGPDNDTEKRERASVGGETEITGGGGGGGKKVWSSYQCEAGASSRS